MKLGTGGRGATLERIVPVLGVNSGVIDWELRVGDSEEAAYAATATATGKLVGGRNLSFRPKLRGNAFYLQLRSSADQWSMERVESEVREGGRIRK